MTKKYIVDCGSGQIETFNTKKEALDFVMNDNESDCWDIWIDDIREVKQ